MRKLCGVILLTTACLCQAQTASDTPVEQWRGKKILVFTPHPDDDAWGCGGTMALLAKNGNQIRIIVYTNDDKGSFDLEMTSERLARIRKAEEEASVEALGIPKSRLTWMGYHDGELEYANPRDLVERTTAIIREFRPDVLFSVDPGEWYERWHKSDHRMAAFNTIDAVRAAEFHLYFPNQLLQQGLKPYRVPLLMFFYSIPQEENYFVNIDSVMEQKIEAYSKQVSQFEPSIDKYRPDWRPEDLQKFRQAIRERHFKKDGHYVEAFRRTTGFNQK
jgi:LmbE family N-acetylglucosaminyl deacetylase